MMQNEKLTAGTADGFRWSLKELLLVIAIAAGFFGILSYIRYPNVFFWYCCIAAGVQTAVYAVGLPRRSLATPRILSVLFGLASMGCLMMVSFATMANCLLHLLWTFGVSKSKPPKTKTVIYASLCITLVSFCLGLYPGFQDGQDLARLRRQFTPVDLSPRLAYESENYQPDSDVPQPIDANLKLFVLEHEGGMRSTWRGRLSMLELLHNERVESFIKTSGFGVGRMHMPLSNPARLDLGMSLRDVPFQTESEPEVIPGYLFGGRYAETESWVQVESGFDPNQEGFHFERLFDFVLPSTLGVEIQGGRIGFVPHGFHWPASVVAGDGGSKLVLERLELVSLLKYEEPRVYLLDHLPRMDQLSGEDIQTRSLDEFEVSSLAELRGGKHLVSENRLGKVRVLGAIPTIDSCRECHATQTGDLLGAFSYRFRVAESTSAESQTVDSSE